MICATSEVTWITAFWMLRLHIHLVNLLLTEYLIIIILFRLWNLHFWSPSVDEGVTDQELCLGSFTCNEITHIIMQIFFFFFFPAKHNWNIIAITVSANTNTEHRSLSKFLLGSTVYSLSNLPFQRKILPQSTKTDQSNVEWPFASSGLASERKKMQSYSGQKLASTDC